MTGGGEAGKSAWTGNTWCGGEGARSWGTESGTQGAGNQIAWPMFLGSRSWVQAPWGVAEGSRSSGQESSAQGAANNKAWYKGTRWRSGLGDKWNSTFRPTFNNFARLEIYAKGLKNKMNATHLEKSPKMCSHC